MFVTFINPTTSNVFIKGTFTNNELVSINDLKCIDIPNGNHKYQYYVDENIIDVPNKAFIIDDGIKYYTINIIDNKYDYIWLKQAYDAGDEDIYGAYYLFKSKELPSSSSPKALLENAKIYFTNNINKSCVYSMYELALIYKNEYKDYNVANKLFKMAADLGHIDAIKILQIHDYNEKKLLKEQQIKLDAYITLANLGDKMAINYLIAYYKTNDDLIESAKWETYLRDSYKSVSKSYIAPPLTY